MSISVQFNRIFWEAAVECLHFGSDNACNRYTQAEERDHLLFELARTHASLRQSGGCSTASQPILTKLKPCLPSALQCAEALSLLDRLAAVAVLLRWQQAKATDITAPSCARSEAQAEVDKLIAQRTELSAAIENLTE